MKVGPHLLFACGNPWLWCLGQGQLHTLRHRFQICLRFGPCTRIIAIRLTTSLFACVTCLPSVLTDLVEFHWFHCNFTKPLSVSMKTIPIQLLSLQICLLLSPLCLEQSWMLVCSSPMALQRTWREQLITISCLPNWHIDRSNSAFQLYLCKSERYSQPFQGTLQSCYRGDWMLTIILKELWPSPMSCYCVNSVTTFVTDKLFQLLSLTS